MVSCLSTATNQSVSSLRHKVFSVLSQFFSAKQIEGVNRCVAKLYNILPDQSYLNRNTVLVAYGGGKDSSYMLAFVRLMQILLFQSHGATFQMRVATNRHAGMPKAVIENIHRVYRALKLYEDPEVELLLIDGNNVSLFGRSRPIPSAVIKRNQQDILMNGHRTQANARPTFCNACNLSMVNSFGVAARYRGGVDVVITGDSRREQRAYLVWANRLAQKVMPSLSSQGSGFTAFLKTMDSIAQSYFREIYGEDSWQEVESRRVVTDGLVKDPLFFSIYDDTDYSASDHWELLTKFLKFEFDDLAFSFSESDCGNPALMAHLRGLKCERVYGRSYVEGIEEYVQFALELMRLKQFPELLINKICQRYSTRQAIELMRYRINAYALESFGITQEQLICMVYAPFTEQGKNLERYLVNEQPHLLSGLVNIKELLNSSVDVPFSEQSFKLMLELRRLSGLNLKQLKACYAASFMALSVDNPAGIIDLVLERDPHKSIIQTRHSPDGAMVNELISGR